MRPNAKAREIAERQKVAFKYYDVIYDLIDEIRAGMAGELGPEAFETVVGRAEIREVFSAGKHGKAAGLLVTEGIIRKALKARITRADVIIYQGEIASLRRFKDDVAEVRAGLECGVTFSQNFVDIKAGDYPRNLRSRNARTDAVRRPSLPLPCRSRGKGLEPMMKTDTTTETRSVRALRVGEQMRHMLSDILARGDVHDDTLAKHLVTVTEVRMSSDLRHATVFVKPLLGKDEEKVLKALRTNTAYLQSEVAEPSEPEICGETEVPGRRQLRRGQPHRHAAAIGQGRAGFG